MRDTANTMPNKPLQKYRVLDLTRVLAGPWCTQNLADLGAEVIKVERPGVGDETRGWGPPWIPTGAAGKRRDSAYFGSANRGKKSITIDFTTAQGQALVRKLAADCDVLVENYKTGTLARYGLGYEDLKAVNPGLVYCSVTGFGHTGPYRHKPGYDFVFQAMSGLMSITGERDDLPGGGPQKVGIAVADITTGMYATVAVLAALLERESRGRGQHLDIALLDCAMAFNSNQAVNYMASGSMPRRYGNAHSNAVPYQVFDTRDGQVVVAVGNDALFAAYCRAAQRPDLCADARFETVSGRLQNRDELLSQLAALMARKTSAQWLALLDAAGVPCAPINNFEQALADPQVKARDIETHIELEDGAVFRTIASPLRFSETPLDHLAGPPTLGQHTADVLRERLGLDEVQQAGLRQAGVI
ncbi:CoA-transferase family III protein [Bordetella bronchiseptica 99-R-0433]|nr:CoA-transferase family III protein [Bordetella bronchiseptica 99-R-0433]